MNGMWNTPRTSSRGETRGRYPSPRARVSDSYFFEELKEYVGFDDDVGARLRECAPVARPHVSAIVDSFYTALEDNPRTRTIFEGPEQIERLRRTLEVWLMEGLEGPWDEAYFEKRRRIGEVHVRVGLLPHFMGGAMNVIRRHLLRVVWEADGFGIDHAEAVERLLDLELTLMTQSYWDSMMRHKLELPLALASGLAHEIRNPLNSIGLNLTLLERRLSKLEESSLVQIVDTARDEVRRMTGLTSDLMDFTKPLEVEPTWVDATSFLGELRQFEEARLEAAGVEVELDVPAGAELFADSDRLRQAILNLVANAVEALEGEEDAGHIMISVAEEPRMTTVSVCDDGPGIPREVAHKLFDIFFTLKASGTGLGLPIVRKIVEAHGGTIELDASRGGACFVIRLPRPPRSTR